MKVVLLFTMALGSALAYGPSFLKPWDDALVEATKFQIGIDNLLSPICGGEKECRVLVYLTAEVCSTPSYGRICQSDCKFLLERVFRRLLVAKRQVELLKDFVPDCCIPGIREEVDKDEEFVPPLDKGERYRVLHVGYDYNLDEGIQEGIFQWQFVDETINSSSCELHGGDEDGERKTMNAGEVLVEDCSEDHPYLNGEIWAVCLNTGSLLKSSNHCQTALDSLRDFVQNEADNATKRNPVEPTLPEPLEAFLGASKFIKEIKLSEGALFDGVTKMDDILAPVGGAMAVIAYKLNYNDTSHEAIIKAFQDFESETIALRIEARKYSDISQNQFIDEEVKKALTELSALEESFASYSKNISKSMTDAVKDSCERFEAGDFLLRLNLNLLEKRPRDIAWSYEFDYKNYTSSLVRPLLVYGIRSAAASIKCAGLLPDQNYQAIKHLASKLKCSLKILYDYLESVNEYIKNNAAREWFEKELTTYVEIHKGYDNFYMVRGLYPVLRNKYDFYDYALVAYDSVDDDGDGNYEEVGQAFDCYGCVGGGNSGFYTRHFGEIGVNSHIVVMYTNSAAPNLNYENVTSLYEKYGDPKLQSFVSALMGLNSKNQRVIANALAVRQGRNFASNNDTAKVGAFYDIHGVNLYFTN